MFDYLLKSAAHTSSIKPRQHILPFDTQYYRVGRQFGLGDSLLGNQEWVQAHVTKLQAAPFPWSNEGLAAWSQLLTVSTDQELLGSGNSFLLRAVVG